MMLTKNEKGIEEMEHFLSMEELESSIAYTIKTIEEMESAYSFLSEATPDYKKFYQKYQDYRIGKKMSHYMGQKAFLDWYSNNELIISDSPNFKNDKEIDDLELEYSVKLDYVKICTTLHQADAYYSFDQELEERILEGYDNTLIGDFDIDDIFAIDFIEAIIYSCNWIKGTEYRCQSHRIPVIFEKEVILTGKD